MSTIGRLANSYTTSRLVYVASGIAVVGYGVNSKTMMIIGGVSALIAPSLESGMSGVTGTSNVVAEVSGEGYRLVRGVMKWAKRAAAPPISIYNYFAGIL